MILHRCTLILELVEILYACIYILGKQLAGKTITFCEDINKFNNSKSDWSFIIIYWPF